MKSEYYDFLVKKAEYYLSEPLSNNSLVYYINFLDLGLSKISFLFPVNNFLNILSAISLGLPVSIWFIDLLIFLYNLLLFLFIFN